MTKSKLEKETLEILLVFDEHRLLILRTLFECRNNNDICGCRLVEKIGITKDLLSYHIKLLREHGYLKEVKCGVKKIYSISETKLLIVEEILKITKLI